MRAEFTRRLLTSFVFSVMKPGFLPGATISKSLLPHSRKQSYFVIRNKYFEFMIQGFVRLFTVSIQHCTDPSNPYIEIHSSLSTPHLSATNLHIVQASLFVDYYNAVPALILSSFRLYTPWFTTRFHKFVFLLLYIPSPRNIVINKSDTVKKTSNENDAGHPNVFFSSVAISE